MVRIMKTYEPAWGMTFNYKGFHNNESFCYLNINGNVVLCTEAPENTGTSVTNMAEHLARDVCWAYDIPMDKIVWIEHYPERIGFKENYSLVKFTIGKGRQGIVEFRNPKWSFISKEEAEQLLSKGE